MTEQVEQANPKYLRRVCQSEICQGKEQTFELQREPFVHPVTGEEYTRYDCLGCKGADMPDGRKAVPVVGFNADGSVMWDRKKDGVPFDVLDKEWQDMDRPGIVAFDPCELHQRPLLSMVTIQSSMTEQDRQWALDVMRCWRCWESDEEGMIRMFRGLNIDLEMMAQTYTLAMLKKPGWKPEAP